MRVEAPPKKPFCFEHWNACTGIPDFGILNFKTFAHVSGLKVNVVLALHGPSRPLRAFECDAVEQRKGSEGISSIAET